jgi:GNAT superfamily N-acetyltransferase
MTSTIEDACHVRRCRDPQFIADVLERDYFDAPIRFFPKSLIRAASDFVAASPRSYFLVADVDGSYAGFVFAHTIGPSLWRRFALSHVMRYGPSLACAVWAQFVAAPLKSSANRDHPTSSATYTGGKAIPECVQQVDHPFRWSPHRPGRGQIDLLFVKAEFRGQGIAPRLLSATATEMADTGVTLIEAHVDPENIPSLRAFLSAGWEAYRTSESDFYLRNEIAQ